MKRIRIVIMLLLIIVVALFIMKVVNKSDQSKETLASPIVENSIGYLEEHAISPLDYTIDKFKDHDVVFLGEWHRIKSQVEFIADLIPQLQNNGIHILVMEFARKIDQPLIDELLSKKEWDEKLARQIIFNEYVFWGYQEYVDIFKAAWQVNQNLEVNDKEFRILGMNNVTDWSFLQTPEDEKNEILRSKVWGGVQDIEAEWAEIIMNEVVDQGEKALVYCGMHHAFTAYQQPIYDFDSGKLIGLINNRAGNHVYSVIGKRCFTIAFHSPWISSKDYEEIVLPVDGSIDHIMKKLSKKFKAIGFDTSGTPLGDLTSTSSYYKYGYVNFTLKDFCDGYIYLEPFCDYEGVTPIKDFINEDNLKIAQQQSPNTYFRNATAKNFNQAIRDDAKIKRIIRHLY